VRPGEAGGRTSPAPALIHIDTAAVDRTGLFRVSGWALAIQPTARVQIFLGNAYLGLAQIGLPAVSASFGARCR
jgi:hypothetical protein